ncbi:MAG: hypothetical protein Q8O14_03560 [bacterium]|nr:hypothetical protein [bacterium]
MDRSPRPLNRLAILLLPLLLACSQTSLQEEGTVRLLDAEQVRLLTPPAAKGALTDWPGDFTLALDPSRAANHNQAGFQLRAPRGCVAQSLVITGRWLGTDVPPALGFDFGPDGTEFLLPLEMQFRLLRQDLEGVDLSLLTVLLDREDGTYEVIPTVIDEQMPGIVRLTANAEHFTRYLIATGPPPDTRTSTY